MTVATKSPLVGIDGTRSFFNFDAVNDGFGNIQLVQRRAGSIGVDQSANAPAMPTVGAATFGAAPWATWVLLKTILANPIRNLITVVNMSTQQVLVVRDDGSVTMFGASVVNGSAFIINPLMSTGIQDAYRSPTFRGALRIFGPSGGLYVSAWED